MANGKSEHNVNDGTANDKVRDRAIFIGTMGPVQNAMGRTLFYSLSSMGQILFSPSPAMGPILFSESLHPWIGHVFAFNSENTN